MLKKSKEVRKELIREFLNKRKTKTTMFYLTGKTKDLLTDEEAFNLRLWRELGIDNPKGEKI